MSKNGGHRFRFYRAGGVEQVVLEKGADVMALGGLDPKLWMALSMPVTGVHVERRTLDLLDSDRDGHVRVPEILAAIAWLGEHHADPDRLFAASDTLPLSAIRDGAVKTAARSILESLGKGTADSIALADVTDTARIFAGAKLNGDGVITAAAADDASVRRAMEEIVTIMGPVMDRSGEPGVDAAGVKAFFAAARALADWEKRTARVARPLPGDATEAAWLAVEAVRAKVEDYFTRCRVAGLDPRAAAAVSASDAELAPLAGRELGAGAPEVARLPIAKIEAGRALPLADGVNPAWSARLADLGEKAVKPLLAGPRQMLSEAEWRQLLAKLASYQAIQVDRPRHEIDALGLERVRELAASDLEGRLEKILAADLARKAEFDRVVEVEKLLRLNRDLVRVLRNFVSFSDFYAGKGAAFQVGTLYLDARSATLCVDVADAGRHASLASLSGMYLVYCDVVRNGEKKAIAAAMTAGESSQILVGRNGVFYDRDGRDWRATITRIVDNPISVREAFFAPYRKFARMVEEQVAKRTSAAEAESHDKLAVTAAATANVGKTPPPPAPPAAEPARKIDVGTVAAIGVAVGGIGAMVAGILSAFFGLGAWMPIGLLAVLLMISGPSMLLAYLKLRRRNLGPLLDANGWAVNGRALVNVPFGAALTQRAALPAGASRSFKDPFKERQAPWRVYATLLVLVSIGAAWYLGKVDGYLPPSVKSSTVLGTGSPP